MSGPESLGSEARLEAPAHIAKLLLLAGREHDAATCETIEVAATDGEHPLSLSEQLRFMRKELYGLMPRPDNPPLRRLIHTDGAEEQLLVVYKKYQAAHERRLVECADQANEFLEAHPRSFVFAKGKELAAITRVAVEYPDERNRWRREPRLHAQVGEERVVPLLAGQLLCDRAALGPQIAAELAALPIEAEG